MTCITSATVQTAVMTINATSITAIAMIFFLIDSLNTGFLFGLAGKPAYIREVAAAICAGWARQDRAQLRHYDVDMDQSWRPWKTSTSRLNRTGKTACHWPPSEVVPPSQPLRERSGDEPATASQF